MFLSVTVYDTQKDPLEMLETFWFQFPIVTWRLRECSFPWTEDLSKVHSPELKIFLKYLYCTANNHSSIRRSTNHKETAEGHSIVMSEFNYRYKQLTNSQHISSLILNICRPHFVANSPKILPLIQYITGDVCWPPSCSSPVEEHSISSRKSRSTLKGWLALDYLPQIPASTPSRKL